MVRIKSAGTPEQATMSALVDTTDKVGTTTPTPLSVLWKAIHLGR